MSTFGDYSGEQLLSMNIRQREWLVQGLIREKDSVILVGNPKAGKSVLVQQLNFSLTSRQEFLDKYDVLKQCRVTEIQLEGELDDKQDRIKRMMEAVQFNPEQYHLIFEKPLELNKTSEISKLINRIKSFHVPDVVIIDPVYFAFQGSLSDDVAVRAFLGNMRILKNMFDCALILVHHTHKLKVDFSTGMAVDEGDNAMFGSQFFKAFPDHILLFTYDKRNNIRVLSCSTQRSGQILDNTTLRLVQPNPLYFETIDNVPTSELSVIDTLRASSRPLTVNELSTITGFTRRTIFRSLKKIGNSVTRIGNGCHTLYAFKTVS